MDKEILTVEEVSQILNVHQRTVRRYIKEKILKANKIGGQWRVTVDDLKIFMNDEGFNEQRVLQNIDNVKSFIDGNYHATSGKIEVCTIVDYYADSSNEVEPLCNALISIINSLETESKFEYTFNKEEKKARFILWGEPEFIGKMLNVFYGTK